MIEIKDLSFSYDNKSDTLKNLFLTIEPNTIHTIMGINGAGKTLLLKLIANLKNIQNGSITNLPKKIHYAFQEPTLIPWLNIFDNFLFCSFEPSEIELYLRKFNLIQFRNSFPHELSGGWAQKVNILRAFLSNPDLILLDEPFAHLDLLQKNELQLFTFNLWQEKKPTILFVTHDIYESIFFSNKISFLKDGQIKENLNLILNPFQGLAIETTLNQSNFIALYEKIFHNFKLEITK